MFQKKDWKIPFVLILLIILLGGYYEKLGVESRTMVLPMAIFIAAGIVISRIKQLQYEIRSARMNAKEIIVQNFSVISSTGKKRVSISTTADTALMNVFDENGTPRVTLDLGHQEPMLKLAGKKGSIGITFDEKGLPNLTIKDDMDKDIWSAR